MSLPDNIFRKDKTQVEGSNVLRPILYPLAVCSYQFTQLVVHTRNTHLHKKTTPGRMARESLQIVEKPTLLRKNNRAAGEFEGARPTSSWIIAIKMA